MSKPGQILKQAWGHSRWGRAGLILISLLLLYGLVAGLVVPPIARAQAEKRLTALVGGAVTLQKLGFQPFSLRLRIRGLSVADPKGLPLLSVSNLVANVQWSSLWRGEAYLREVLVDRPVVQVQRDGEGRINLLELQRRIVGEPAPADTNAAPAPLFPLTLAQLVLTNGVVAVRDDVPAGGFQAVLDPISLGVQGFSTRPGVTSRWDISISADQGERFTGQGTASLDPLAAGGVVRGEHLLLPRPRPYLDDLSPALAITNGLASFEIAFDGGQAGEEFSLEVRDGKVGVTDLALVSTEDGVPFAEAAALSLGGMRASLGRRSATVGLLEVNGVRLHARRFPGPTQEAPTQSNLRGILAPEVVEGVVRNLTDWQLTLERFSLVNSRVDWEDTVIQPPARLGLDQIGVQATGLTNESNQPPATIEARLRWCEAGDIRLQATGSVLPARAQAGLQLADLVLSPLDPYVAQFARLELGRGNLNANFDARYGAGEADQPLVGVTGNLVVTNFAAVETAGGTDFIRWDAVEFNGIRVGLEPNLIALDELVARRLQTSLILMTNGQLNVLELLRETRDLSQAAAVPEEGDATATAQEGDSAASAPSPSAVEAAVPADASAGPSPPPATPQTGDTPPEAAPVEVAVSESEAPEATPTAGDGEPKSEAPFWETWPVRLGKLQVEGLGIFAADNFYAGGFKTTVESLDGEVRNLALPTTTPASIDLKGRLSAVSDFSLAGELNPDPEHFAADLHLAANRADLVQFTPYTLKFASYPVTRGELTADVHYRIDGAALEAENKILLDQFTLGAKDPQPEAIDLPVKLGVSLLKDSEGKIDLDLPLSGTLDDPEFRVAPILWQAVRNIVLKAAAAPFKLLGSLLGGDGDETFDSIEFEPGLAVIQASQTNRLALLPAALEKRPELHLVVVPGFHPAQDRRGLALQELDRRLRSLRVEEIGASGAPIPEADRVQLTAEDRARLVLVAYQREFGAPPPAVLAASTNALAAPPSGGSTNLNAMAEASPSGTATPAAPAASVTPSTPTMPAPSPSQVATERLLQVTDITVERLHQLARERATAVADQLLAGGAVAADRVTVAEEVVDNPSDTPTPRVTFQLE